MKRIILLTLVLLVIAVGFSCGGAEPPAPSGSGADSPTEAYKRLFAAVKSKDVEAIKAEMTAKTLEFAKMAASRNNTPIEKVFENGFTATTMTPNLPEIRDERIKDDMGAVEVWNTKDSKWEDLPFINENGGWKLAVGDLFADTFKSPGRGLDSREKEAANSNGQGMVPMQMPANANSNMVNPTVNSNIVPIKPVERQEKK